eukprot:TRINITY_DN2536_c0_g1_i1.p1 TRINITY_DN2536_c0_g1~~TRINITY_DN2536_c0_g1_i1.p1  ORF type:complete len:173 (-),score=30.12 TRINITY_DN2536_c0_g1_i1:55-573(-)
MVYSVIIHSTELEKDIIVYCSYFFTRRGNDSQKIARQTAIIRKVQDDLSIFQSYSPNDTDIKGTFTLPGQTKLFKTEKVVIWRKIYGSVFTIVCDRNENTLLASTFVDIFIKTLNEHFKNDKLFIQPTELLNKPEEVLILLSTYLPNGKLLISTSKHIKHLKTESDNTILGK